MKHILQNFISPFLTFEKKGVPITTLCVSFQVPEHTALAFVSALLNNKTQNELPPLPKPRLVGNADGSEQTRNQRTNNRFLNPKHTELSAGPNNLPYRAHISILRNIPCIPRAHSGTYWPDDPNTPGVTIILDHSDAPKTTNVQTVHRALQHFYVCERNISLIKDHHTSDDAYVL